jgi:hypothetical protein
VFADLVPGVYRLSEGALGAGWQVGYSSETVTVVAGETARATVTNTYVEQLAPPGVGSAIVTTVVTGDPPAITYHIGLVGPAPSTTEHWLTVTGAGEVTFSGLPVGTYTVVERDPGANYTVTISPKTIEVTNGGVARATVTNAYAAVQSSAGVLPASGSGAAPVFIALAVMLMVPGIVLVALSRRRKVG